MVARMSDWDQALSGWGILGCLGALLTAFMTLALLGLVQPLLAQVAIGVLFAATSLMFPRLGLCLLVLVAPVQGLWGATRQDMPMLLAVLMAAVNLRHLVEWRHLGRTLRDGMLPLPLCVFGAFILFYVLRGLPELPGMPEQPLHYVMREAGFLILLFGASLAAFLHCRGENGDAMRLGLIGAVGLALLLTLFIDVAAVYFPSLGRDWALQTAWQGLRLSGLHANPNATAKFLIAGECFTLAVLWCLLGVGFESRPRPKMFGAALFLALAALVIFSLALGATLSKSGLLAGVMAPLMAGLAFWAKRLRGAAVAAMISALMVGGLALGFNILLLNGLSKTVLERRMQLEQGGAKPPVAAGERAAQPKTTLTERLGKQLRLGQSHEMVIKAEKPGDPPVKHSEIYRNIDGAIEYKDRNCQDIGCTGQRDRLWKTGLSVWGEHWFFGIGPGNWPGEYMRRERFPFDSPHNALIELGGGFGIIGLALYALLIFALFRVSRSAFSSPSQGNITAIHTRGTLMFAWAILIAEWVDPVKFLAISPHTIWLWLLLAAIVSPVRDTNAAGRGA